MPFPKSLVVALALLGFVPFAAADTDAPAPKETATPATPARPAPRPQKRLSDPYARLPEVKIVPGAAPAAPVAAPENKNLFVLPKMTVNGNKGKVPTLPRIFVQPPVRNVPEPYMPEYETPEARAARLAQKHIPPLQQKLNGKHASESKALAAEAREQSAKQLNSIADLIELSAALGLDDPAEQKRLRAEYQNALLDRPR